MTNQSIYARNICKSYKEKKVLENLNLELEPNKIYGLIGRNGAGKTTLLSVLSAQAKATGGRVFIGELPVWENQEALNHICFSREISSGSILLQGLKVSEYLRIASIYFPDWDTEYADALMKIFELDAKKRISKLSKGMTSMLTIIVALASKADFTFLDEPVAGLDIVARERFYKLLLEEYSASGRTFVISTHIIEEATDIFEEVILIKEGDILLKENTQALLERSYQVIGREDEVEKCVQGLRTHCRESFGRSVGLTVILEPGQKLGEDCEVDVVPVSLPKVFLALCGEEEA